jgi:AAA family ATP:ADP antiporter
MAYIPLDEALKSKGKAAADVIGGRLGKSGGAFIQFIMLSMIAGSSLISLAPNLFVIFVFIIIIWFVAAHLLSKEFNKLAKKNDITKSN